MSTPPERIWLQTPPNAAGSWDWTWADHEVDGSDTEYVRADLAGPTKPAAQWTETEEAQATYLIAAMTGRAVHEVEGPLSEFLHSLNAGRREDVPGMVVTDLGAWEGEDGG
jgi:hypothetical protein